MALIGKFYQDGDKLTVREQQDAGKPPKTTPRF
jgi:hypothetical protein